MSRFDYCEDDGEGLPYGLWEANISRALGGGRGQRALADMEAALTALPEPKLIGGHLADEDGVCAVGAFVAKRRADAEGTDMAAAVAAMAESVRCYCGHKRDEHYPEGGCSGKGWEGRACYCRSWEVEDDANETAKAGRRAGLAWSVAWHLAYLNDEKFRDASPEERYGLMLAWVRRAQGKETVAA